MISRTDVKELVNDLFEEEALVIGGLVAVHRMTDGQYRLITSMATGVDAHPVAVELLADGAPETEGALVLRPDAEPSFRAMKMAAHVQPRAICRAYLRKHGLKTSSDGAHGARNVTVVLSCIILAVRLGIRYRTRWPPRLFHVQVYEQ